MKRVTLNQQAALTRFARLRKTRCASPIKSIKILICYEKPPLVEYTNVNIREFKVISENN